MGFGLVFERDVRNLMLRICEECPAEIIDDDGELV